MCALLTGGGYAARVNVPATPAPEHRTPNTVPSSESRTHRRIVKYSCGKPRYPAIVTDGYCH
ncbi:hypothetical protein FRAHR75_60140 [Frankia sp. Hr75.2]|nr:hypothetical protein FRAHR75_60140 [Frankia sp. Hr75.2]SQD98348.1 hypothetical protein FMEAI12_4630005 [Parafrankia sp. Ea1.12]